MIAILMMSAKLPTVGLLKKRQFEPIIYDYGIIIYVHDVTDKILSHDSNYIVDVVM